MYCQNFEESHHARLSILFILLSPLIFSARRLINIIKENRCVILMGDDDGAATVHHSTRPWAKISPVCGRHLGSVSVVQGFLSSGRGLQLIPAPVLRASDLGNTVLLRSLVHGRHPLLVAPQHKGDYPTETWGSTEGKRVNICDHPNNKDI